jgi:lipoyl-dependent peroxiredoxin subunit D
MNIAEKVDAFLDEKYAGMTSSIFRDLSLNFKKLLEDGPLEPIERFQNLLAASVALENKELMTWSAGILTELGLAPDALRETAEIAGIMGMNNVYYKFRSYLPDEVKDGYQRAGLRMQS